MPRCEEDGYVKIQDKLPCKSLKINARMMRAEEQGPMQESIQD